MVTDAQTHTYNSKNNSKQRRTAGGIICYRIIVTKIVYHCYKNRHDQWNRIEDPSINPHNKSTKRPKLHPKEKVAPSKSCAGKIG